jgi:tRNA(Ile)-lysidine synthase
LLTQNATQNLVLTHSSFKGSIRSYRDRIQYVPATSLDASALTVGVSWRGESSVNFAAGRVNFSRSNTPDRTAAAQPSTRQLRPIQLGESWLIRARREKDKIRLSPNSGGVSVKNMFQQANIPPWLRSEWPILTCNGRVAAIPGVAVDYEFAASDADAGYTLSFHFLPPGIARR